MTAEKIRIWNLARWTYNLEPYYYQYTLLPNWPMQQNSTGDCGDQVHNTQAMGFPDNSSCTNRRNPCKPGSILILQSTNIYLKMSSQYYHSDLYCDIRLCFNSNKEWFGVEINLNSLWNRALELEDVVLCGSLLSQCLGGFLFQVCGYTMNMKKFWFW